MSQGPLRTPRSEEPAHALRVDTRWPVVFAVLAVALLLTMMPDRVRVLPVWTPGVLGIVLIMPMAAVMLSRDKERWLPIERTITLVFCVAVGSGMIAGLALLIGEMVRRSGEVSGVQLLTSSVALWVLNVLTFSLLYWQLDRGGPEARANTGETEAGLALSARRRSPGRAVRLAADVCRLSVPWILDRDRVQYDGCHATDVPRQDVDDARKHDLARDDRGRHVTGDQHSRKLSSHHTFTALARAQHQTQTFRSGSTGLIPRRPVCGEQIHQRPQLV